MMYISKDSLIKMQCMLEPVMKTANFLIRNNLMVAVFKSEWHKTDMSLIENFIGHNVQTYLVFIVVFLLVFNYIKKREWKGLPPGPFCFPLLGSLPFLGSDIREPIRKMGEKYGDVFTIYLGRVWN